MSLESRIMRVLTFFAYMILYLLMFLSPFLVVTALVYGSMYLVNEWNVMPGVVVLIWFILFLSGLSAWSKVYKGVDPFSGDRR